MLTDLQKKKLTRLFQVFDNDSSGSIEQRDYDRLAANLANVRGWAPGSKEAVTLKNKLNEQWQMTLAKGDTNRDGVISLEEWYAFMDGILSNKAAYEQTLRQLGASITELLDRDSDGKITLEDFKLYFKAYGIDVGTAPEIFNGIDLNKDGTVTQDELIKAVEEFYYGNDPKAPGNFLAGRY